MMKYRVNKGKSSLYSVAGLSLPVPLHSKREGLVMKWQLSDNCSNDKKQRVGISGHLFAMRNVKNIFPRGSVLIPSLLKWLG